MTTPSLAEAAKAVIAANDAAETPEDMLKAIDAIDALRAALEAMEGAENALGIGKCRDCKFWRPAGATTLWGHCWRSHPDRMTPEMPWFCAEDHTKPVVTSEGFGCVLFAMADPHTPAKERP